MRGRARIEYFGGPYDGLEVRLDLPLTQRLQSPDLDASRASVHVYALAVHPASEPRRYVYVGEQPQG